MQSKSEKRNQARKNAETKSAQRKVERSSKSSATVNNSKPGQKGKSIVPQAKKK